MKTSLLIGVLLCSFLVSFLINDEHALTSIVEASSKQDDVELIPTEKAFTIIKSKTPALTNSKTTYALASLNDLSLQDLAMMVNSGFFDYNPWLSGKVSSYLLRFDYPQLQSAYERLHKAELVGRYRFMRLLVSSMAKRSSVDTLEFLIRFPFDRTILAHLGIVFNNVNTENSQELAQWILSKDYFTVIKPIGFSVANVFASAAEQSFDTTLAYLPQAHVHLKQHVISGLMQSFSEYAQYQALLEYITNNENLVLRQMVINRMATNFPENTANWLANTATESFSEEVYKHIFLAKLKISFNEAANWYIQNTTDTHEEAINYVFFRSSRSNSPDNLLKWAQTLPTEHTQFAIAEMLSWQVRENHQFVLDRLSMVNDKQSRFFISIKLVNTLGQESPQLLNEFVANSEFAEELSERAARYKVSDDE